MKRRHRTRRISKGKIILACFFLFIASAYIIFETQIEPSFLDLTRLKAEELSTTAINTAVLKILDENNYTYEDFVKVNANDSTVTNISTNTVTANRFKSMISLAAQEEIGNMSGMEVNYRLGDFCGAEILNGRGPEIIVKIYLSSSVITDIESTFDSCGINQTKHTLNVKVTAKVYITSDDDLDTYTTVVTTVPVAENIIVGHTPSINIQKE